MLPTLFYINTKSLLLLILLILFIVSHVNFDDAQALNTKCSLRLFEKNKILPSCLYMPNGGSGSGRQQSVMIPLLASRSDCWGFIAGKVPLGW